MSLDSLLIVLICVLVNYLMIIPVFYFLLKERISTIDNIIAARIPRKRIELAKSRNLLARDLLTSIVWPVLFIRGSLNGVKKKK